MFLNDGHSHTAGEVRHRISTTHLQMVDDVIGVNIDHAPRLLVGEHGQPDVDRSIVLAFEKLQGETAHDMYNVQCTCKWQLHVKINEKLLLSCKKVSESAGGD